MTTVHVILQAHIDPIWLWPWQAGLDATLATLRSACDRLDAHPDIYFSHGEAWTYWQIEQIDPGLFERIRRHVAARRWEIVGGWWIQPDCNLPSIEGFRRQIELGREYFQAKFGTWPRVGYNIDSFGHTASLPTIMSEFGQDRYVMMRPQEHEMTLPARIFRWRQAEGLPEATTFRISTTYCTNAGMQERYVPAALSELPAEVGHTMLFVGVGDHGGGPTEQLIEWCRVNRDRFDGARLEFSTVGRFFDAIEADRPKLPVVTGELQYHAVGCYSVFRQVKAAVRDAEQRLVQAEVAVANDPAPPADARDRLRDAWRDVCFHQFHDTIGGTCLPSAYPAVFAQIGRATATGEELVAHSLRRQIGKLPDDRLQRMVLCNASEVAFDDFVEVEPWLDWQTWQPGWRVIDDDGRRVPYQLVPSEAFMGPQMSRLLLKTFIGPGAMRVLRIERSDGPGEPPAEVAPAHRLEPRLTLIADETDTWSHSISGYGREPVASAEWEAPVTVDCGPLMSSTHRRGRIGRSDLRLETHHYAGERFVEFRLRVQWAECQKVLKWALPLPAKTVRRVDAISGGALERPLDGREHPFADWTRLDLADGRVIGLVSTDAFGMDVTADEVRLTLLRSCYLAHHAPHPPRETGGRVSDQGEHDFRLRIYVGPEVTGDLLARQAIGLRRPPAFADLTRGMPGWIGRH